MTAPASPRSTSQTHVGTLLVVGVMLAALTEAVASTVLALGRSDIIGDIYATPDEFAWLDMGYIALKLIGFIIAPSLIARFNPQRILLASTLAMGSSSALAAVSSHLDYLVILRLVQGSAGGLLLVAGQTFLFLKYPKRWQPTVQALFAIGAVVAPATIAPALQGWLVDHQSWTWIFLANVPIALAAIGLLMISETDPPALVDASPFDLLNTALLSIFFVCMTYILTQGSRWDWFEEPRITWLSFIATGAALAFAARALLAPAAHGIDLRLFLDGDYAFAFIVSFVAGAALFGSAYLIPSFSVSVLALTLSEAGRLLLPSAGLFIISLLLAALLIQHYGISPIATVPFGILLTMCAMWMLSGSTVQSGSNDMTPALMVRGLGLGFLFLSITLVAFGRLSRSMLASGIGYFNVGRQLGGLIGVAYLQTLLDHQVIGNQAVLAANVAAGMPAVTERLAATTSILIGSGMETLAAGKAALVILARSVTAQSTVIAFDTAFNSLALLFVIAVPIVIAIKIMLSRAYAARQHRIEHAQRSDTTTAGAVDDTL
jgi:DHA2 family multidrug resistance protein